MKKEFDTYLFDFDGTLIDSYESLVYVFEGAYARVGVKVPEGYTRHLMRVPLYVGYKELNGPEDEESKKIFGDAIIELLDDPHTLKITKTYEEVKDTLLRLHKLGKRLGIVTSNNRKHVKEVLKAVDIDENIFSIIVGNQESKRHKPYPDPILKALELLDISNEGVAYVGDGLDDMRCAVASNVFPLLLDRHNEYQDIDFYKINTLDELLK